MEQQQREAAMALPVVFVRPAACSHCAGPWPAGSSWHHCCGELQDAGAKDLSTSGLEPSSSAGGVRLAAEPCALGRQTQWPEAWGPACGLLLPGGPAPGPAVPPRCPLCCPVPLHGHCFPARQHPCLANPSSCLKCCHQGKKQCCHCFYKSSFLKHLSQVN